MPLEKLQKQILDDAKRKADEIEGEARKQAAEVVKQAKETAKGIEDEANSEIEQELAREEAEYAANAELQEQSILLGAREHVVEGLMPKLKSMTAKKLRVSGYSKLINLAVKEAHSIAPDEDLTVVIGKNDAKLVKDFGGKVRYGDFGGGVEIYTKNGAIKISAKVEDLFDDSAAAIKTELIKEAFSKIKGGKKPSRTEPAKRARKKAVKKGKKR